MTNEEAIEWIKELRDGWNDTTNVTACNMAIKALEQQPCDDCISRADARHLIAEVNRKTLGCTSVKAFKTLYNGIDDLPPVTPQPKIGRWEWVQYDSNPNIGNWHCSECRTIVPYMPENAKHTPIRKWCPNCGARMEVNLNE